MYLQNCSLCASAMEQGGIYSTPADFPTLCSVVEIGMTGILTDFLESRRKYICNSCFVHTVNKLNTNTTLKRNLRSGLKDSLKLIAKEIIKINIRIIQAEKRKIRMTTTETTKASAPAHSVITGAGKSRFTLTDGPSMVNTGTSYSTFIIGESSLGKGFGTGRGSSRQLDLVAKPASKSPINWSSEITFSNSDSTVEALETITYTSSESVQSESDLPPTDVSEDDNELDPEGAELKELLGFLQGELKGEWFDSRRAVSGLSYDVQDELLMEIFRGQTETVPLVRSSGTKGCKLPASRTPEPWLEQKPGFHLGQAGGATDKNNSNLPWTSTSNGQEYENVEISVSCITTDTDGSTGSSDVDEPDYLCGECGSVITIYDPLHPLVDHHTCPNITSA